MTEMDDLGPSATFASYNTLLSGLMAQHTANLFTASADHVQQCSWQYAHRHTTQAPACVLFWEGNINMTSIISLEVLHICSRVSGSVLDDAPAA